MTSDNYILYVDDSDDDTLMAKRAFNKSNLSTSIVTLTDGQECIDYLFSEGEFPDRIIRCRQLFCWI